jgi:hypothetical protein
MSLDHPKFRFSITCHTDDPAVLFCLRALVQFVEKHPKQQIGWGGTKTKDWKAARGNFTLRFTSPAFRDGFVKEANRLLSGRWEQVGISDQDPAEPRRTRPMD